MIAILLISMILAPASAASQAKYLTSPCPEIFQYGLGKGVEVKGVIDLVVPKDSIFDFNISTTFSRVTSCRRSPRMELLEADTPLRIMEKISKGQSIRVLVSFDDPMRVQDIRLNGRVVCGEERDSDEETNREVTASVEFSPSKAVVKKFNWFKSVRCGGLASSPKEFLEGRKWILEVRFPKDTDSQWSWVTWALLISPRHLLSFEFKFKENQDAKIYRAFTNGTELVSLVSNVTRLDPYRWFSPVILTLESPIEDVEPICLDVFDARPVERVLMVDASENPDSLKWADNLNTTLVGAENCIPFLKGENRETVKFVLEHGVAQERLYCDDVGTYELALRRHTNVSGESFWSLFASWFQGGFFLTSREYIEAVINAVE